MWQDPELIAPEPRGGTGTLARDAGVSLLDEIDWELIAIMWEDDMAEVTSPLKVNPSYDPDLMIDLVATQEPSRFLAGGDFRLSLNCIGKYALDAAQMNGKYADNLLVIQIAVIRDPKKRGQILEELGIDPD